MLYVFTGDNKHLRDKEASAFIESFRSRYGDLAIESYIGEELDKEKISEIVTVQPFLTEKRLVRIRSLASNKTLLEKFIELAINLADNIDIVLVEDKLDSRAKTTTKLKKIADIRGFSVLEGRDLEDWVINQIAENGSTIDRQTVQYLIDRLGSNQELLEREIHKLCLYTKNIDKQAIDSLTMPIASSSIFNMLDNLISGNTDKALRLYEDQRAQGMEPQAILGMITWQLISLAMVRSGIGQNSDDIVKKTGLSPFVVRKNQLIAKNISKNKMIKMIDTTIKVDLTMKTAKIDYDNAIRQLIIDLSI